MRRLPLWARHQRAARAGWQQVRSNPVAAMMGIAVLGVALGFPAILYALLSNQAAVLSAWGGEPTLTVFLKTDTGDEAARLASQDIERMPAFKQVTRITPEQALAEFVAIAGIEPGSFAEQNPLPYVLVVTPRANAFADPGEDALRQLIKQVSQVEQVVIDHAWLERLAALTRLSSRLTIIIALLLGVAAILVVGNTIRSLVLAQLSEIEVYATVGATPAFIRRPFIYSGAIHGLAAGVLAVIVVEIVLLALRGPINEFTGAYLNDYVFTGPSLTFLLALLLGGGLIGVGGAWLGAHTTLGQHLRELDV